MDIQKIKIEKLNAAKYNPRRELKPGDAEYEKLKKSIKEFGYVDPVIVNKDYTVIGGHQRISVLKDLEYKEIECIVVDVDKTKEKLLNLSLNKISGNWEYEKLNALINELLEASADLDVTGFSEEEIRDMTEELDVQDSDFLKDTEIVKEKEIKKCPNCGYEL